MSQREERVPVAPELKKALIGLREAEVGFARAWQGWTDFDDPQAVARRREVEAWERRIENAQEEVRKWMDTKE